MPRLVGRLDDFRLSAERRQHTRKRFSAELAARRLAILAPTLKPWAMRADGVDFGSDRMKEQRCWRP